MKRVNIFFTVYLQYVNMNLNKYHFMLNHRICSHLAYTAHTAYTAVLMIMRNAN